MSRKISILIFVLCALTQSASLQQPKPAVVGEEKKDNGSAASAFATPTEPENSLTPQQFAQLIEKVSEPNGYFDTDNLISNETSYLHVMGKMRKMNVSGGAYIGVGPDQNFSYIAQIRPRIVFISDIRRDNLLQHLWFKSLFALSRDRLEYLCLMFGVPVPSELKPWETQGVQELVAYLDKTPAKRELFEKNWTAVSEKLKSFGPTLAPSDLETIKRIHAEFFESGLDLKFTSKNRSPRPYYPSYRELLLEKDLTGKRCNYLANEDDYKFLKSLEERNLVIPVVGNLSGGGALRQIAAYLKARSLTVSALYTSNVEFYLMRNYREEEFNPFAENLKALPRDERSVIIRSYFNGTWGYSHPHTVAGYYSTQLLQTFDSFIKEYAGGGYESYSDVIGKHLLDLR
jgi:hypothetical protein